MLCAAGKTTLVNFILTGASRLLPLHCRSTAAPLPPARCLVPLPPAAAACSLVAAAAPLLPFLTAGEHGKKVAVIENEYGEVSRQAGERQTRAALGRHLRACRAHAALS